MEVILKNLTKKFPSRDKKKHEDVIAVNNFDFTIPENCQAWVTLPGREKELFPAGKQQHFYQEQD